MKKGTGGEIKSAGWSVKSFLNSKVGLQCRQGQQRERPRWRRLTSGKRSLQAQRGPLSYSLNPPNLVASEVTLNPNSTSRTRKQQDLFQRRQKTTAGKRNLGSFFSNASWTLLVLIGFSRRPQRVRCPSSRVPAEQQYDTCYLRPRLGDFRPRVWSLKKFIELGNL